MDPHVERMAVEANELSERMSKLKGFLATDTFNGLKRTDRDLLQAQYSIMASYHQVLSIRIERATGVLGE